MHDDRQSLVDFKPAKPSNGIDPELLDDDGRPMPGAALARIRIRDRMKNLGIEPGSAAHNAVKRHMRWLVRQEARSVYLGTEWFRKLRDDPDALDRRLNVINADFGSKR